MNLNQITIQVFDVEKSISFYEKLGLILIVKSLPNYARFICLTGDATFSLHRSETSSHYSGTWIYFETENLDDVVEALINKGIEIDQMPQEMPWLWREARLTDLDANQIILYYAGENRLNPPWRI